MRPAHSLCLSFAIAVAPLACQDTNAPSVPTELAFTVQPSDVAAGAAVSPAVQVVLRDAQGNTVADSTVAVTLALASGTGTAGATLSGTLTQAAVAGVATFSDLVLDKAGGGYVLAASATGLVSDSSTAFSVNPGGAAKLVFTVQPSAVAAGEAIAPAVRVAVLDALDNAVTGSTPAVSIAIASGTGGSGAVLGGTLGVTAENGVATFGDLTVDRAGYGYFLTASASGVASVASTSFDIIPRWYLVTDLGSLGGTSVQPAAINGSGQVVGSSTLSDGATHAFLWSPDSANAVTGQMADLGVPAGYTATTAVDINDAGQAVGNATPASGYSARAFLWAAGGTELINGPVGSSYSHAVGINAGGMVLLLSGGPFIWSSGALTYIGGGMSPTAWMPSGINDSGVAVGSMTLGAGMGTQVAWSYAAGVNSTFGNWVPIALNNRGEIVGNPQSTHGTVYTGILWQNGSGTPLSGLTPGVSSLFVRAINNMTQIVGVSEGRGVVWENGFTYDLNRMLPSSAGIVLQAATGINDRGQIVGAGIWGGVRRALLLTPIR